MKVGDILKAKCCFCKEEHEWRVNLIGGKNGYANPGEVDCIVVGWPDNNPCKEGIYCQWIPIP